MKRLYRVERNKIVGGVCGGLAEYFEIDPVVIRVLFVVLFVGWGISLLAYIILWIVTPKKYNLIESADGINNDLNNDFTGGNSEEINYQHLKNQKIFGGWVLIAIGFVWLIDNVFDFFDFSILLAIVIILIGLFVLLSNRNSHLSDKINHLNVQS